MSKVLAGVVAGIAMLGLAACGDNDSTTTQGADEAAPPPAAAPDAAPAVPPADSGGMETSPAPAPQ